MSMVFLSAVLFAGSVNAACELTCEGECRQAVAMCKLGAALEARADKMACLNELNGGLLECHAAYYGARVECAEVCVEDLRACAQEARVGFKECREAVREAVEGCKAEAAGWKRDLKTECGAAKASCMAECRGEPQDGGGLS